MLSFFLIFFAAVLEFAQKYWVYGIGFFSQGVFGIRMLIQWYLSEKEGKIVSPVIFWQLSLVAGFLFLVYGILQHDFVIILGQALSYIISIRNLQLDGAWKPMPWSFRFSAVAFPIAAMIWMLMQSAILPSDLNAKSFFELFFFMGALGQLLLNIRFLYQWYYAEKTKSSFLPLGFWLMTAIGSVLTVVYAVYHFDPVLLFAQGLGLIAALRNIQLHFKTKTAE